MLTKAPRLYSAEISQQQMLNQVVFTPTNGNLNLIESSVELLAGDSNLMSIRSRTSANRPFVLVDKMPQRHGADFLRR
jgi:hypothetical protein